MAKLNRSKSFKKILYKKILVIIMAVVSDRHMELITAAKIERGREREINGTVYERIWMVMIIIVAVMVLVVVVVVAVMMIVAQYNRNTTQN